MILNMLEKYQTSDTLHKLKETVRQCRETNKEAKWTLITEKRLNSTDGVYATCGNCNTQNETIRIAGCALNHCNFTHFG